ncbi:unnamed protein product [Dicrocoelium dendriticum]|nr:unnamed protein product [Dicrocoelium dendriticum]
MFSTNERFSKVSCRDEQYETTTLDVHHPHKLILQLRISPDRDRPPTKDISISLLNVVSKLGSNQSNCIQVDSVNRDPSRNSWTAIVNVHVTAETPPSCDMFGDRTPQISFACESLASQGNEDDRRFKLDYSDDLNSQLMDPLDNIEAQLFIHWYLNEQLMGCPVIQYNLTKHHFNKAAVITGPIPETFCQEVMKFARDKFNTAILTFLIPK